MTFGIAAYTDRNDEILYDYVPYHLFRVIKFRGCGSGSLTLPPLSRNRRYVAVSGKYGDGTVHHEVPMSEGEVYSVVQSLSVSGNTVHLRTGLTSNVSLQIMFKDYFVSVFITER